MDGNILLFSHSRTKNIVSILISKLRSHESIKEDYINFMHRNYQQWMEIFFSSHIPERRISFTFQFLYQKIKKSRINQRRLYIFHVSQLSIPQSDQQWMEIFFSSHILEQRISFQFLYQN